MQQREGSPHFPTLGPTRSTREAPSLTDRQRRIAPPIRRTLESPHPADPTPAWRCNSPVVPRLGTSRSCASQSCGDGPEESILGPGTRGEPPRLSLGSLRRPQPRSSQRGAAWSSCGGRDQPALSCTRRASQGRRRQCRLHHQLLLGPGTPEASRDHRDQKRCWPDGRMRSLGRCRDQVPRALRRRGCRHSSGGPRMRDRPSPHDVHPSFDRQDLDRSRGGDRRQVSHRPGRTTDRRLPHPTGDDVHRTRALPCYGRHHVAGRRELRRSLRANLTCRTRSDRERCSGPCKMGGPDP